MFSGHKVITQYTRLCSVEHKVFPFFNYNSLRAFYLIFTHKTNLGQKIQTHITMVVQYYYTFRHVSAIFKEFIHQI